MVIFAYLYYDSNKKCFTYLILFIGLFGFVMFQIWLINFFCVYYDTLKLSYEQSISECIIKEIKPMVYVPKKGNTIN